ncbi:hypothetical protein MAMC_01446 [Methylacidimicrobium cyclopophantes]|uniref:DUF72 domain-containing protein n=1 Tax=Methylacidimicrobium cyclopophantes TaxID=1041766 RepID=A0A5E6MD88_9BACT|nr:DUF72 domain-containing protein [Methylacidimicrobium cyclopophantes]VVM07141.1 hypothetical protein MAMC_01446 [Methylacidimicrobium cyclopophantes]
MEKGLSKGSELPGGREPRCPIYVGTSGWNYSDWRSILYDESPRDQWLALYARRFPAVEVDSSFYRRHRPQTYRRWAEATPADFAFSMKGHRFITHVQRLRDSEASIRLGLEDASPLGPKLKAFLWQLPASFRKDLGRLESFARSLAELRGAVRHVLEFRHPSWFAPEVASLLGRYRLASCQSDAADWPLWDAVTTDLVFVRLHGAKATYRSSYTQDELLSWAERAKAWQREARTVHLYFDNTAGGAAVENALRLLALLHPRESSA